MRLFQRQLPGFTLIELIITVAITALVVGGSIAGFVNFTDRQEVLNSAQRVQQMMRNAQSNARVRVMPEEDVNNDPCTALYSYRVNYISGSRAFTIRPICALADGSPVAGDEIAASRITVPSGITISAASWTDFRSLEDGVAFSGGTPPIEFQFSKGTYNFQFTVSSTGSISNVEPF